MFISYIELRLLVDDDYLCVFLLVEVLKGHSRKLLKATNGQDAVDLCNRHPEIDLVLMDVRMPVMTGIEATKKIKSFRKNLPIIAVTAGVLPGNKQKFIKDGFDDLISKPINIEKLLVVVQKYVLFKIH